MTYEVTSDGRADPVPGTELPEDDDDGPVPAPHLATALEDWREPWTNPARSEWSR